MAIVMLGTVVLFRMKRGHFAWVTMLPAAWLLACTLTAGWQKIFSADPKIGFLSHAAKYSEGLASGVLVLAAAAWTATPEQKTSAARALVQSGYNFDRVVDGVMAALSAIEEGAI